ncbi:hypothetical protein RirG_074070 [Rhizophagus irregularis DAOM 197198w]|uniref:Uncharacterized protein n=1 Tax=Rhizophagus irregularis (strain DAOM 197198w) TaxID=1432141 RepID=A0A015JQW5_RHIIW|nr:hypothetical protein RirG_074070 [Rhizophagus irregularis DAOM 197198w]
MSGWKYSFERLSKHEYVACIIHPKKVVCICGQKIKLNRKWEKDYLNRHIQRSGCKADKGQRTIYNWFKPIEVKPVKQVEEEEEEYDSDVYDNMDDDDLIRVDEVNENDQNQEILAINIEETSDNTRNTKKQKLICMGLQSEEISKYIKRTPAQFGGSRRIEVVARELFPNLFSQKFSRKKLNSKQKRQLNHALFAESIWQIDRPSNAVRAKACTGIAERGNICTECSYIRYNQALCNKIARPLPLSSNIKFTPKHYWEDNPLKRCLKNCDLRDIWNILNNESENQQENPWIALADKALKGAFKDKPIFTGLCEVMGDAIERKMKNKSKRNLKYSDEFTSFLTILGGISSRALDLFRQNLEGRTIQSIRQLRRNDDDYLTNPELCYENVARVKRLIDTVNYNGPICAMTDNTKLKPRLRYSPNLGCIIGSTLSNEETTVNIYNDIPKIINNVKSENGIAKNVRAYILQIPLSKFPPIVIALLPNKGADTADLILQLHKRLILEIAPQLSLHILSLGSDGAITEYQAQQLIVNIQTSEKLTVIEPQLKINFSCPIFNYIGPIIRVQDPKHAKKTARNAIMSGARLLTFGNSSARYDHFLQLINQNSSILYKNDVIKLDRQDDAAAYRTFCSSNFRQCLTTDYQVKIGMEGFAVYIFIIGKISRIFICH